jgi:hypothetical protein
MTWRALAALMSRFMTLMSTLMTPLSTVMALMSMVPTCRMLMTSMILTRRTPRFF